MRNKTFRKHERQIEDIVQKAITAQVVNLSVKYICDVAKISRQAFYAHYSDVNDVIRTQEERLRNDFKKRIGTNTNREVIFTIILTFVKDNSRYFLIVFDREDFKMLTWMIDYVHLNIVPKGTKDPSYRQYRSVLKSTVQIWMLPGRPTKQNLPIYVNELLRTRVMRSRLDDVSLTQSSVYTA